MHQVLRALLTHDRPLEQSMWRSFWDELRDGGLPSGEAVALLASLSTRMPDHDGLSGFLRSLEERRPEAVTRLDDTVNIVGSGGGPHTFNISTAAAFTAAAMGVRVVKTGSRAYSGTCGSFDLLERLGIGLTGSYEQTTATLEQFGLAFAGGFVYPRELTLLARRILPMELRTLGGFINSIGPFLAAMPVSAQLVGVSDPALLPSLRQFAATVTDRRVWLCTNDLGIDELVSGVDNVIHTNEGLGEIHLRATALGAEPGTIAELRPADPAESVVEHFLDVLSGDRQDLAARTVCLNAAAMAVASGLVSEWTQAVTTATDALRGGAALDLVHRLRTHTAAAAGLR
ncbi:anthranilate phosphoribosyltransferase [Streptomyces sp. NPDC047315]|uniref:anthranilate phosphoribosyltransferase n=1 Tax=Streptomyces sp. NPDC047315 TaxID=3155142 RepID=UPI0033EC8423